MIIFGEDHYDQQIRVIGARLMREFRAKRGDHFFMEGAEDWICAAREEDYRLPAGSCRLLEQDSEIEVRFQASEALLDSRLRDCIDYIAAHAPAAPAPPMLDDELAIKAYLRRWVPQLPAGARAEFSSLRKMHREAYRQYSRLFESTLPERDRHMAKVLMRDRGSGWNFAIVGANHLRGLREHLDTLPCVFMLPRMIAAREPGMRLLRSARDEL